MTGHFLWLCICLEEEVSNGSFMCRFTFWEEKLVLCSSDSVFLPPLIEQFMPVPGLQGVWFSLPRLTKYTPSHLPSPHLSFLIPSALFSIVLVLIITFSLPSLSVYHHSQFITTLSLSSLSAYHHNY
jgi:hypothetical protein